MHRLFGKKKETAPPPTLNDAQISIGNRLSQHEQKIQAIDRELVNMKQQMQRMKPGTPGHNQLKNRALTLIKQKKMYEKQRDSMFNQQFNIDQQQFTQESLKDTATTVAAMKASNKQLKQEFKKIDIDEIDDLYDEMMDMQETHNEIQDVMGRSLDNELYDDDELLGELDDLENDMFNEEFDEVPNYLINATTAEKNAQRQQAPQQYEQQSTYDNGRPVVRNIPL
eukprot:UN00024